MRHSISYFNSHQFYETKDRTQEVFSMPPYEESVEQDGTTDHGRHGKDDSDTFVTAIIRAFENYKTLVSFSRAQHGVIPQDRPRKEDFNLAGQVTMPESDPSTIDASSYVIERYYPPCRETVESLKAISIAEMRCGSHHKARKLSAKVIGTAIIRNGIQTVVEDRLGDATSLVVCNAPPNVKPEDLLPIGSLVVIKQPMFEAWSKGNGGFRYDIRVDHFSDLVIKLTPDHVGSLKALGAIEWKLKGNNHWRKQDSWNATAWYVWLFVTVKTMLTWDY